MSLQALFDGRFEKYFSENADQPEAYWHFIHIPKTAGSSFRLQVSAALKPEANLVIDRKSADVPHRDRLVKAVRAFQASPDFAKCRFASGHIPRVIARPLLASTRPTRIITMLRDPVARVVSDYRYQRTDAHADRDQAIRKFPTFESYIRAPGTQDKMYKFLRENPTQAVGDVMKSIEEQFAFVGLTELYDWSMSVLFRLLGVQAQPALHSRKTQAVAENQIEDVDRWRDVIRELNPNDVRLYEHFRQRLETARGQMARAA